MITTTHTTLTFEIIHTDDTTGAQSKISVEPVAPDPRRNSTWKDWRTIIHANGSRTPIGPLHADRSAAITYARAYAQRLGWR